MFQPNFLWIQPLLTSVLNLNKKFKELSIFFMYKFAYSTTIFLRISDI